LQCKENCPSDGDDDDNTEGNEETDGDDDDTAPRRNEATDPESLKKIMTSHIKNQDGLAEKLANADPERKKQMKHRIKSKRAEVGKKMANVDPASLKKKLEERIQNKKANTLPRRNEAADADGCHNTASLGTWCPTDGGKLYCKDHCPEVLKGRNVPAKRLKLINDALEHAGKDENDCYNLEKHGVWCGQGESLQCKENCPSDGDDDDNTEGNDDDEDQQTTMPTILP